MTIIKDNLLISVWAQMKDEALFSSCFYPKGTMPTHWKQEQNKAFCISKLVVLHTIATSLSRLHGIKDRLIGNSNKYLMAESCPTIQDRQVQSEASPTCNRTEQLPLVSVAGNSGTKLNEGIVLPMFTLGIVSTK